METYSLGEIIRSLRKQAGLSQEELADGICSAVSVSRIENGAQMPSAAVLERLLQRLGSGTYQLCSIYYKNEQQRAFERQAKQIHKWIEQGDAQRARDQLELLHGKAQDTHSRQLYLLLEGAILLQEQGPPEQVVSTLRQALALTRPELKEEEFHHTLLSVQEANVLSVMVAALYQTDRRKAIALGEELMKALRRQDSSLKEYCVIKINLALNLAGCLDEEGRFQEALEQIALGLEWSIGNAEQMLLPELLFTKACILRHLGQEAACRDIIRAIVPYMDLIQKTAFAKYVREYAQEKLNIQL